MIIYANSLFLFFFFVFSQLHNYFSVYIPKLLLNHSHTFLFMYHIYIYYIVNGNQGTETNNNLSVKITAAWPFPFVSRRVPFSYSQPPTPFLSVFLQFTVVYVHGIYLIHTRTHRHSLFISLCLSGSPEECEGLRKMALDFYYNLVCTTTYFWHRKWVAASWLTSTPLPPPLSPLPAPSHASSVNIHWKLGAENDYG